MAFLENKRIILATILALALAISGFWVLGKSENKKTYVKTEPPLTAAEKPSAESPDSDNDGLKDWEEKLWGMDLQSSDTDGDGIPDGEEIKLGLNTPTPKEEPITTESENLTQKMTKNLFVSYIQQRRSGLDPKTTAEQIAGALTDEGVGFDFKDDFSLKNMTVVQDHSAEETKNYANKLAEISNKYGSEIKENELDMLARLIRRSNSSNNFVPFNDFKTYSLAYKNAANETAKLVVPQDYLSAHLEYANALNNLAKINSAFSQFMSDPITGLSAVNTYLNEAERIKNSLSTLGVLIRKDGLVFKPDEAGFALVSLINILQ